MKNWLFGVFFLMVIPVSAQDIEIYKTDDFTIFNNRVEQSSYKAEALSDRRMVSDYKSAEAKEYNSTVQFKFSINSRDNEMISGTDHFVTLLPMGGFCTTGPLVFGQQFIDTIGQVLVLPENTVWNIKLDMRRVLKDFATMGYFVLFNGQQIYNEDFKGVYIAGGAAPLSWDFENLYTNPDFELKDPDGDGIFETTITLNLHNEEPPIKEWELSTEINDFPQFKSGHLLANALYNMSLEEMVQNIRPDGAFMAGKQWDGVWTRDISYAIQLAMAMVNPEASKKSLMYKVKNKRIIQDTGTGGSWPVSTDRMVWTLAAWEVYNVTGDQNWLAQSFEIIRNSWDDDRKTAFDSNTGLYYGESSFLDWREQTYPKWMEPIDIYQSFNLGTNAVYHQATSILAEMARLLGLPRSEYEEAARQLSLSINKYLWQPEKQYYAQYIYGNVDKLASPRSESLGEALCILSGIAAQETAVKMVSSVPVTAFGIPCIYPQIPQIPPYHNNAVWPFVQAYWALASAKAGNEEAVLQSIAAIYRPAALFLTNKENFVATNGDYKRTAINSDRQLWSVAANLAIVYKLYFGMHFSPDGIHFKPFVPEKINGKKELTGFRYQNAILDIYLSGEGSRMKSFLLDGVNVPQAFIDSRITGRHKIEICLESDTEVGSNVNLKPVVFSLPAPDYSVSEDSLIISKSADVSRYVVYRNGSVWAEGSKTSYLLPSDSLYTEYMVVAIDSLEYTSFSGKPIVRYDTEMEQIIEAESFAEKAALQYNGYSGSGFVELTTDKNIHLTFNTELYESGRYIFRFRNSNGSGPVNTNNKCAIRTLMVDGTEVGPIVMPQRGNEEWSNWGYSNSLTMQLSAGRHNFSIEYILPQNQNMNGETNKAMLDAFSIVRLN
ncbi:MAG: hypothetical protein RBS07_08350 [Lentimicrobium sp.]|nr:hypothetical protein [Lentimicrobium sp.]